MIYPSTAVLASDGVGTAVLAQPSGFGEAFGEAFGGWVTTVGAVITGPPATAVLATDGTSTAVLVPVAPSTAVLTEVYALAELQLV